MSEEGNAKPQVTHRELLLAGIRLFESGRFWDSHESWEKAWLRLAPDSPERLTLQAAIQAAGAFHLLEIRNPRPDAACRLCRLSLEKLARAQARIASGARPAAEWVEVPGLASLLEAVIRDPGAWQGPLRAQVQGLRAFLREP